MPYSLLLAFAQGSGGGGARPDVPIFRAGTTLVEFTIVATDQRGQPVTDLNQNEIAILQNGKPQPVAFFRFEGAAFGPDAVEPVRESIAPGIFTNRAEYSPGPARNVTAIVIDSLNTLPEDQVAVKAQVMQYLRALAPNTRVAVYALGSNLRILHDFTDDLDALRARLAKHNIEFNIQAIPADELVRRQLKWKPSISTRRSTDDDPETTQTRTREPRPSAGSSSQRPWSHGQAGRTVPGTASLRRMIPDNCVTRGAGQPSCRYTGTEEPGLD